MNKILFALLSPVLFVLAAHAEDELKIKGRIAADASLYRFGMQSLCWDARPGESISFSLPAADNPRRELSFFLYAAAPSDGKIEAVIGDPGRKCDFKFDIPLNFSNWRAIRVAPVEDLRETTNPGATDQVTLIYRGQNPVKLNLDAIKPAASWQRVPNFQLPFINPKRPAMTQTDVPGDLFMAEYRKLEKRRDAPPAASEAQRDALRNLRKRVRAWLTASGLPADDPLAAARHQIIQKAAREALERYRTLDIRESNGRYQFKSVPVPRDGYDPAWLALGARTAFPLACAYSIPFPGNDFFQNQEVKEAVVNLLGLMRYQGYAEGADHNWHAIFASWGLGQTLFLMSKELGEAGLLDDLRRAQLWFSRFNAMSIDPVKWSPPSADFLRTGAIDSLASILTMDDNAANARLPAFKNILDAQLVVTGGYGDLIKPDGSAFHHGQVAHAAYGPDALHALAAMACLLQKTPYAPNPGRLNELRRALITFDRQQQHFDTPAATNVRWAFHSAAARPLVPAYAYWVLLDPRDREMAAIFKRQFNEAELAKSNFRFLNYSDAEGQLGAMKQVAHQAARMIREQPKPPQGAFNYYNSALLIHRRDDWMAAVRGFGKYAWDVEVGARNPAGYENKYCRFVSHGALQIFGNGRNAAASGRVDSGWDFAHFPGTTALNLKPEELELPVSMGYGRTFGEAKLVGGGTVNHRNSAYAFELRDPVNQDFTAYKSYHLAGNLVVALGTDIKNNQSGVDTDTTIFQNYLAASGENRPDKTFNGKTANVLADSSGNTYYIPGGQELVVSRKMQTGPNERGDASRSGYFEKALLRHGRAPKDGRYEYAVRINAAPAGSAEFKSGKLPYEVLRADDKLHAVHIPSELLVSAMVIEPGVEIPSPSPVRSMSIPGILLCEKDRSSGRWTISVTDPDFGYPAAPEKLGPDSHPVARAVTLELHGRWKVETGNARLSDSGCEITVVPGVSEEFVISPR